MDRERKVGRRPLFTGVHRFAIERCDAHTVRAFIWLCKMKEAENGKEVGGRELTGFSPKSFDCGQAAEGVE
jgi:hypothetical protein